MFTDRTDAGEKLADALDERREESDEVVCIETPEPFGAVGRHYRTFGQVTDDEVRATLRR